MKCAAFYVAIGTFLLWGALAQGLVGQDRDRDRGGGVEESVDDEEIGRSMREEGDFNSRLLPSRPDRDRRWYLGVEVDYRDYGAVITRVVRGSPARNAGLETRDVIVTVNGYQIGMVGGRLYSLERELELRASRRGLVRLLVQNQRSGELSSLEVQLERAGQSGNVGDRGIVAGTVTVRQLGQLPRSAVLAVRLVDMSDPRAAAIPIVQKTYRDLGPLPIPFELEYDRTQIVPGRRYALQAAVTVNGMPAYQTRDRYEVLTPGSPRRTDMILESSR
jgi:putative lipoprotein